MKDTGSVSSQGHERGFGASTEKKQSCSKSRYQSFEKKSSNPCEMSAASGDPTKGFALAL